MIQFKNIQTPAFEFHGKPRWFLGARRFLPCAGPWPNCRRRRCRSRWRKSHKKGAEKTTQDWYLGWIFTKSGNLTSRNCDLWGFMGSNEQRLVFSLLSHRNPYSYGGKTAKTHRFLICEADSRSPEGSSAITFSMVQ